MMQKNSEELLMDDSPVLSDDPVVAILLNGEAETVHEAEEKYLDQNLDEVIRLVESSMPDDEFRRHPLIALLLSHGSRGWEDSLL